MLNMTTTVHRLPATLVVALCGALGRPAPQAQDVKVTDPASVVLIVNRDSNDIGVHGHQDPEDDRAGRSSATTSTRTW